MGKVFLAIRTIEKRIQLDGQMVSLMHILQVLLTKALLEKLLVQLKVSLSYECHWEIGNPLIKRN